MSAEIIYLFPNMKNTRNKDSAPKENTPLENYTEILNNSGLDQDDIDEIVDCINDNGLYVDLDPDLKVMVDTWFDDYYPAVSRQ